MPHAARKASRTTLITAFLAVIVLPGLVQITGWNPGAVDSAEKRTLAEFPGVPHSWSALRNWPTNVDHWFQDHFGLRHMLIRAHSRWMYFVLHTSPQPKVILGRDGWLYLNGKAFNDGDPVSDARAINPLPPAQLERWRWTFQDLSDWFTARGVPFIVALVPGKETMYPEHLPTYMTRVGPETTVQLANRHFKEHASFPVVDLYEAMQQARAEHLSYCTTDTHWNEFGAFRAYQAIMNKAAELKPGAGLEPLPEADFIREDYVHEGGDLAGMIDLKPALRNSYVIMHPRRARQAALTMLDDTEIADAMTRLPDATRPRLLVLRDSFTVALIPYFGEHFSHGMYRWISRGVDMKTIEKTRPDVVFFILGDRQLRHPLRYPATIQSWACLRRFDTATHQLVGCDSTRGFAALKVPTHIAQETHSAGLRLLPRDPNPSLQFDLPALDASRLALVKVALTVPDKCDLTLTWKSDPQTAASGEKAKAAINLLRGKNEICLPIVDPSAHGPFQLSVSGKIKDLTFHSFEVRTIPR